MRPFITLPLLVRTSTPQTWTDQTKEYVVKDLSLDPQSIESFHPEAKERYMLLHTSSGKTYLIDCSQQELLDLLGYSHAT